jgi:thiol-disulfide isomerase/thioredoxin
MNNRPARAVLGALVILLGIAVGAWVHFSRDTADGRQGVKVAAGVASAPNASDVAAEPEDVAPQDALPARRIPEHLPQFSLEDTSGKSIPIQSFADNSSLIINFWATWCAPCRSEIPLLETLHAEWADRGMRVVGIAVDHREPVLDFAKRFKITYPLLIGEQDALDAAAALGVGSPVFPFTVFTDRRGEVVALFIGELHRPQAELILSQVQSLNQGQIELAAARRAITTGLRALRAAAST